MYIYRIYIYTDLLCPPINYKYECEPLTQRDDPPDPPDPPSLHAPRCQESFQATDFRLKEAAVFVFARGDLYRWLKTWVYWGINLEW